MKKRRAKVDSRDRNMEIRVALYLRLSEEDRDKQHECDDSVSIQNQRSMLIAYAQLHGWEIYKVYSDDDYAGTDRKRPAFNELLKDAEAGKFNIVLCKSQSRFTREMELVEKYLHTLFPIWGIRFISLTDNADTANKGNKKARQINGLVNEWYLEDLSGNIKAGLTERRLKGYHIGAFCAYGYKKDPDQKGHLIPDEEAAAVVHRIFEMYVEGMGKLAIARQLNLEGIPNPTEYKIQKGIRWKRNYGGKRGGLWCYYTITSILTNEMYIGNMIQARYESVSYKTHQNRPKPREEWIRVENTHEPIIERGLWDKAQKIIRSRSRPRQNGRMGPFAGKVRCMYCGYNMKTTKNGKHDRRYLTCSTKKVTNATYCRGGFIGETELQETVLKELDKIIAKYLDMDEAERQLQVEDDLKQERDKVEREIFQLKKQLNNKEQALKLLYEDRAQGIISAEEYVRLSDAFRQDIIEYEKKRDELYGRRDALQEQKQQVISKRELLRQFAQIDELTYDIVNTLIDYVEVGRREGHYTVARVPVVIHWKF